MPLFELSSGNIVGLVQVSFAEAGILERTDLQRLLRERVEVIAPETIIVSEEFGDWEDSRRRIDLLGVGRDANLVVIELKRTEDGGHMELQALRYAAMVSTMTFERTVEVFNEHLRRLGRTDDARTVLLEFLGWQAADEEKFAQDVRIVLASAEFSREVTTTVMWLNDHGLDLRCVRLRPYRHGADLILDVQQVIPLPEASDYQVRLREKSQRERVSRQTAHSQEGAFQEFWMELVDRLGGLTPPILTNRPPQVGRHFGLPTGRAGITYVVTFRVDGQIRVSLTIDRGTAEMSKSVFDMLARDRESIEAQVKVVLDWERVEGQRRCRIFASRPGSVNDPSPAREEHQEWIVTMLSRFRQILGSRLDALPVAFAGEDLVVPPGEEEYVSDS